MSRNLRTQRSAAAAAIASLLLGPGAAMAQQAPADAVSAQPFALPPVPAAPAAGAADATDAQVTLRRIDVRGNTVLAESDLAALTAPYLGRQVSLAEIESLRQRLSRLYVERGYVNSGVQSPREIADGQLVFTVVEGRLTHIRLRGMERLDEAYVRRRLQPDAQQALNFDALRERFQLLLSDPLFERMHARMLPGARLGEAILDVDVARARPWQLAVFANNHRPVAIGANALGLNGSISNLSGQGDVLDASLQGPLGRGRGARGTLGWRMPLGQGGTALTAALDRGASSVTEEPARELDIHSRLDSSDIGLSHAFINTLGQKAELGVNRTWRVNRTWLLGQPYSFTPGEPDGRTRETLWRLWADYVRRSTSQVLALRVTYIGGGNNLQQIAGLPPNGAAGRRFRIWQAQAQYGRQVLDNGAELVVRAALQGTHDHLLALDAMAVGGAATVRGFRENQLVRDNGATATLELDYPLLNEASRGLALRPFVDIGRAHNVGETGATLASAGVAGRLRWHGVLAELAVAGKLRHSVALPGGATLQDQGVHLQVSYKF
ncbi:ShlB/FhaC/HecB family hemolysin secretion/activation protein [Pseudoduganella rivuli]|nr:ShlB/FhaC/HecB family hemolysin secretion/activation protein [Pseudoduganella rivuli]